MVDILIIAGLCVAAWYFRDKIKAFFKSMMGE